MKTVYAAFVSGLLLACSGGSDDDAFQQWADAWKAMDARAFTATYRLAGSGEHPVETGTLTWYWQGPQRPRFDSDVENGTQSDRTIIIQVGDSRVVCEPGPQVCSDYLTALQGSDFEALSLLLPLGSFDDLPLTLEDDWQEARDYYSTVREFNEDGAQCYEAEFDVGRQSDCFREDGIIVRRELRTTIGGADEPPEGGLTWELIEASDGADPTAFSPPFEVSHEGN